MSLYVNNLAHYYSSYRAITKLSVGHCAVIFMSYFYTKIIQSNILSVRVRQTNMITILDNSEHSVISDEDFSSTIDEALKIMDNDNDGYINYWEYVLAKHQVATAEADPAPASADAVPAVNSVPDDDIAAPAPQAAPAPAVVPT